MTDLGLFVSFESSYCMTSFVVLFSLRQYDDLFVSSYRLFEDALVGRLVWLCPDARFECLKIASVLKNTKKQAVFSLFSAFFVP